ncbi:MAG: Membrane-bound lytic murein transglycosylase F [Desulfovibrio sp.]
MFTPGNHYRRVCSRRFLGALVVAVNVLMKVFRLPLGFELHLMRDFQSFRGYRHFVVTALRFLAVLLAGVIEALKWLCIAFFVVLLLQLFGLTSASAADIPRAAEQHRATLIRAAHAVWGLDAPVAVFAGQIHAESRWNPNAKSPVGAQGLAQFMPATAAWLPTVAPETGEPMPYNPGWAIRALVTYDLWLWNKVSAANDYERMAFTLSAYNGGLGWVNRDKRLAERKGLNPRRWFGHVETVNAGRSAANFRENRNYPRLILQDYQWRYSGVGWGAGLPEPE